MSSKTKIEWTEQTWNPVTGCTKVSAGCKHCYAEVMAKRLKAMGANGYDNGFELSIMPDRLNQPLKRKKPTTYFVNSMSDLFHEGVSDDFIDQVFDVIKRTPQHRYQVLTKRAERLSSYFKDRIIPDNVWLGVTVENIKEGLPRIDLLRQVNANVRFLSIEPLLEDLGEIDFTDIHWAIVGGESGARARPMDEEWVTNIKKQCDEQEVSASSLNSGDHGVLTRLKEASMKMVESCLIGHGMLCLSKVERKHAKIIVINEVILWKFWLITRCNCYIMPL